MTLDHKNARASRGGKGQSGCGSMILLWSESEGWMRKWGGGATKRWVGVAGSRQGREGNGGGWRHGCGREGNGIRERGRAERRTEARKTGWVFN
ncbi:hypothetical protein HNY73_019757 [Argiope bruennichi]|uniref:Uncharacterized protein n=1 Tax=Argiope bruennichi TaxID=94029 RepID=A0A8T0E727_ARGBR|nr:hypothetical protein HNY73_019757 [Argiope bruennichi]